MIRSERLSALYQVSRSPAAGIKPSYPPRLSSGHRLRLLPIVIGLLAASAAQAVEWSDLSCTLNGRSSSKCSLSGTFTDDPEYWAFTIKTADGQTLSVQSGGTGEWPLSVNGSPAKGTRRSGDCVETTAGWRLCWTYEPRNPIPRGRWTTGGRCPRDTIAPFEPSFRADFVGQTRAGSNYRCTLGRELNEFGDPTFEETCIRGGRTERGTVQYIWRNPYQVRITAFTLGPRAKPWLEADATLCEDGYATLLSD